MNEMIKSILTGNQRNKRLGVIVAVGLVAILMILITDDLPSCTHESDPPKDEWTSDKYVRDLESELEEVISLVDGAGRCKVFVTLENDAEYVYVSEDKVRRDSSESRTTAGGESNDISEDTESSYIIIDGRDGEEALVRTRLMPTINGVAVLCEGADDPETAERIEKVVTTALNISSRRVCITLLSE